MRRSTRPAGSAAWSMTISQRVLAPRSSSGSRATSRRPACARCAAAASGRRSTSAASTAPRAADSAAPSGSRTGSSPCSSASERRDGDVGHRHHARGRDRACANQRDGVGRGQPGPAVLRDDGQRRHPAARGTSRRCRRPRRRTPARAVRGVAEPQLDRGVEPEQLVVEPAQGLVREARPRAGRRRRTRTSRVTDGHRRRAASRARAGRRAAGGARGRSWARCSRRLPRGPRRVHDAGGVGARQPRDRQRAPTASRRGSVMPLRSAIGRQAVASPYSR